MHLPIVCPCGATYPGDIVLEGNPVVCPKCGRLNVLRVATAGIPKAAIPEWMIIPILAHLAVVSVVIVLVGWAGASLLSPRAEGQATSRAVVSESNGQTNLAVSIVQSASTDGKNSEMAPKQPSEESLRIPIVGLSRTQSDLSNDEAPPALELFESRISWLLDAPKDEKKLITPIEIITMDKGDLHFSVRRLALDGDAPKALKLAVTPAAHDDVQRILTRMGDGYRFTTLKNQSWMSYPTLKNFDVVFLTCADVYAQDFQAALPLRQFVEQGGTLYASDLRGDIVLAAFPEFRARMPVTPGVPQKVDANVVDKGLQLYLHRKTIPLTLEAEGWRPAGFDPSKIEVMLDGSYRNQLGHTQTAPLLVKFRAKRGHVIFTSFHHSKNDSEIVRKLLDYLVFASVSARSEARVRDLMQRYEFAPEALRPIVLEAGKKSEGEYQHPGGAMQIALGFENQGAKLKLTLRAPGGQTIEHEDQGIFLIEIPKAVAGAWKYTVTPVDLPHTNFPIVVAVGLHK